MSKLFRDIDTLKFDPANSRKHDERNIKAIMESLKEHGQRKPIVLYSDMVVAGNGTLEAAKRLGWTEIWVNNDPFPSLEAAKAYALQDNRSAELAAWDNVQLGDTLSELKDAGYDLDGLGWNDGDLKGIMSDKSGTEGLTDPDEVPEVAQNEFGVKRGDIWKLGNHRLMCGDSTLKEDVEKLMNGEKADITFTSPPYNAAKDSHLNKSSVSGFENKYKKNSDDLTDDDYLSLLVKSTQIALDKSDYAFVNLQLLAHNKKVLIKFQHENVDNLKDILIWNKKQCPPNIVKGAFNTKFEFIYCFANPERNKTRAFPCEWRGQYPNVIETESNSGNEFAADHKAGFPIAFPIWFLDKFDFAKSVYEPFCGTGTTIIACEKTGRKCYGMELDEHYCSVIIKRWQDFTGKKAEKIVEGT